MKRRLVTLVLAIGLLAGPALASDRSGFLTPLTDWWTALVALWAAPPAETPSVAPAGEKSTTAPGSTDPGPTTDGTPPVPGSACIDPNGQPRPC